MKKSSDAMSEEEAGWKPMQGALLIWQEVLRRRQLGQSYACGAQNQLARAFKKSDPSAAAVFRDVLSGAGTGSVPKRLRFFLGLGSQILLCHRA